MKHSESSGLSNSYLSDVPLLKGSMSATINLRNNKPNQNITKTHEKK